MKIHCTRLTQDNVMAEAFRATCGHFVKMDKTQALRSEHSPIRCLLYWLDFVEVPQRVVNHLTRHKHGVEWFVETSRPDRNGQSTELRNMSCLINAQALIAISRQRLCYKAWHETREIWEAVHEAVRQTDQDMANAMMPNCKYRGQCVEQYPCRKVMQ